MFRGKVTALVGGQYGSEGKGVIARHIADDYAVHVRTGAPNAGHTFHHEGRNWVARSVPVGWVNPEASIVIGPGALIDAALLRAEVKEIEAAGYEIRGRLFIDGRAVLVDPVRHHAHEGGVDGVAHLLIGSTGEGVGPARMAKIARGTWPKDVPWAKCERVMDRPDLFEWVNCGVEFNTVTLVNDMIDTGHAVLLEGTQGSGLSLTYGPWPYVTSTDTNAASLAADAGIAPSLVTSTILVCRTFPIRVAGNSGPLPNETSFEEIGVEPETTTVTKKTRRIAEWDDEVVMDAIRVNRPNQIAITFADYIDPDARGAEIWSDLPDSVQRWLLDTEIRLGVEITMVSCGPAGCPIVGLA